MRHLHYSTRDRFTLCSIIRLTPGVISVHFSKARKATDCATCREVYRRALPPSWSFSRRSVSKKESR